MYRRSKDGMDIGFQQKGKATAETTKPALHLRGLEYKDGKETSLGNEPDFLEYLSPRYLELSDIKIGRCKAVKGLAGRCEMCTTPPTQPSLSRIQIP
ncbi:hypothetical protein HYALB_00008890 [Hymenoscyphus albidus]|uniref:Uncharacterized protein n=1 Tax=Hymenoscyphus albidus TaxID=595503 RepID=A0A9N9LR18_9HELO|nr:hypothetical protein HYALB_00008890 [Hymenoscyphus albidus]